MAQKRLILTEAQLAALEKAKTEKEAHGEFESISLRPPISSTTSAAVLRQA
jgi:hypothetical protein